MDLTAVLFALAPSVGIGFLFYKVIKALLEGDRNERLAHARWEAEQDRIAAADAGSGAATGAPARADKGVERDAGGPVQAPSTLTDPGNR